MNQGEIEKAIQNATPQKPIKHELGGGYYYTCPWMKCNNTVHPWNRYCSQCGQRLRWSKDDDLIEILTKEVLANG